MGRMRRWMREWSGRILGVEDLAWRLETAATGRLVGLIGGW